MSISPVTRYLRQATRKDGEPLNILCAPTHEAYETGLARTGHNFYALQHSSFKKWVKSYRKLPDNYHLLREEKDNIVRNVPLSVGFDLVLSQNKFGQYQVLAQMARALNIPFISLEHTLPHIEWQQKKIEQCVNLRGHQNVYISEYSVGKWGDSLERFDTSVIHHGIDTDLFNPNKAEKVNQVYALCVCNDWINRDWCCGYGVWEDIKKHTDIPFKVFGDTPGLSKPAPTTEILAQEYANAPIFLNTSTISPVPTSLLEAMASGCAVVSTATCMVPEIIQNGFNGFISNNPQELAEYIEKLRKDENLRKQMGQAARATVLQKFGLDKFVENWNEMFYKVANEIR